MNLSAIYSLIYTLGELTLAEKGISSAKVILTGFVVVFSVLLLLIIVIKVYSSIVEKALSTGQKKKSKKTEEPPKPMPAVVNVNVPAAAESSDADEEIPGEIIAVISAAVASMYGGEKKVKIKSVKKSGSARSAWANAGVLENTRPF